MLSPDECLPLGKIGALQNAPSGEWANLAERAFVWLKIRATVPHRLVL